MNFFNALTLKNKIFVSCLGIILLVSFLIALFTRSLLISGLTGELKKRGIGIAQGVADGARVHILTRNRAELTAIAYDAKLGNRKDIMQYVLISDNQGHILAHTFTTGFPPGIPALVKQQPVETEQIIPMKINHHWVFHVVVPVKEGIYTIGSVQAGLDRQHIEQLISDLRLLFFSFLSTVSIIFFFLSHRLALRITQPVSALIRYTEKITQGNFNPFTGTDTPDPTEAPRARDDELARLTSAFMKMAHQLQLSTNRLKASQKKYRSLFRSGPNPIFVVEKKSLDILDVNPTASEILGYTQKELLHMSLFSLARLKDRQFTGHVPDGDALDDPTRLSRSKVQFHKKNGESLFVNIHASPSEYRSRSVFIVAATDITELVEKDAQLIQASKMANLEKMSAGIAHEINQPLNAIKMGSEYLAMMLEKKKDIPEQDLQMVAGEISAQVSRAAEIVGRLQTFSRKADFSREITHVNDCIRSVNRIIGRQITLQNIVLKLDLDPAIPPILAHNNRMEQVIFNLITNARDAIHERIDTRGDIDTGVITVTTFHEKNHVGITVADNGTGIATHHQDRIFESFYTTKPMGEGLGLGLPILHGIITDYNGTIHVENSSTGGALFTILFPAGPGLSEKETGKYS